MKCPRCGWARMYVSRMSSPIHMTRVLTHSLCFSWETSTKYLWESHQPSVFLSTFIGAQSFPKAGGWKQEKTAKFFSPSPFRLVSSVCPATLPRIDALESSYQPHGKTAVYSLKFSSPKRPLVYGLWMRPNGERSLKERLGNILTSPPSKMGRGSVPPASPFYSTWRSSLRLTYLKYHL